MEIHLIFTKNNKLKFSILNNQYHHGDFKICFSLVYSIQEIDGGIISKKVGRYYEIHSEQDEVIFTLQEPRIGSYNLSCGPEGLFVIGKNNQIIECEITSLEFDPVIPLPNNLKLEKETIHIKNLDFKISPGEKDFFKNFDNLLKVSDIKFNVSTGHSIFFIKQNLRSEEYKINIKKDSILIEYSDYGGKFYSIITLIQLINFYNTNLPLGIIEDRPSLNWRGMHLDCARQFYTIDEIKRLMNYMCFFKLNRFHWHLTDNEAWRVELECYPNLTKVGAFRGYNHTIPPFYGTGYNKTGGYYSRSQINELIQYARQRNIEIMPEIDLPAHSWTLLQVMPELRDSSSNIISEDVGNYTDNTINPAVEETNIFLKNILEELSEIFLFNIIHVGVDERPKSHGKDRTK